MSDKRRELPTYFVQECQVVSCSRYLFVDMRRCSVRKIAEKLQWKPPFEITRVIQNIRENKGGREREREVGYVLVLRYQ